MSNGETGSDGGTNSLRGLLGLVVAVVTVAVFVFLLRWQQDAKSKRDLRDGNSDSMSDYIQRANVARGRGKE